MATDAHASPSAPKRRPSTAWAPASLSALALGALLWRLHFQAQAHTFDTLLYARSLWGVAHGDLFNPILEQHAFAIHGHFLAALLAPLVWLMPAALVLILAQSCALGATVWLAARAFESQAAAQGQSARAGLLGLWGALAVTVGAPLVLNPFFYDARPDLIAVPFMTAALLRARGRGGFDALALMAMVAAALAREEFALVAASALALAPPSPEQPAAEGRRLLGIKGRLLGAALFAGAFALFFVGLRGWLLGGADDSSVFHLSGSAQGEVVGYGELLPVKAQILAALALSAGGLMWPGWRWMGSILPGLGFLMVSRWMAEHQISFHYSMLLAPGVIAASVDGYGRLSERVGRARLGMLVAVVGFVGAGAFLWVGAAPGGGRFQAGLFDLEDGEGGWRWSLERSPWLVDAHAQLEAIEPGVGVAAPSRLSARLADRPFVTTDGTAAHQLETRGAVQAEIERVALLHKDWATVGRQLVQGQGFSLVGWGGGPLVVLSRGAGRPEIFEVIRAVQGAPTCGAAVGRWPGGGLAICAAERDGRGRVVVTLKREAAGGEAEAWLQLEGAEGSARLWLIEGLLRLEEVPVGAVVKLSTMEAVEASSGGVVLARGESALEVEGGGDGVGVRWALDRP